MLIKERRGYILCRFSFVEEGAFICNAHMLEHSRWKFSCIMCPFHILTEIDKVGPGNGFVISPVVCLSRLKHIFRYALFWPWYIFFIRTGFLLALTFLSEEEKSEGKGAQQMPTLWNRNWYLIKKLHREHLKWLKRHFPRDRKTQIYLQWSQLVRKGVQSTKKFVGHAI